MADHIERKTHELKLRIEFCDAVLNGTKTFEIRENDRGFQKGDYVSFSSIYKDGAKAWHVVDKKLYEITYVLSGWGIKEGLVAFGIREVKNEID